MPDSWWLKVKQAQRHMVEIHHEARAFSKSEPYKVIRVLQPKKKRHIWRYVLSFTDQPDPMIAVILGDFLHNLRSALDHVVVACSARKDKASASFPVAFEDIWAKDASGQYVVRDDERRKRFNSATRGLTPEARAAVIWEQPYNKGPDGAALDILGIISRLGNADKHRELLTVRAPSTCRSSASPSVGCHRFTALSPSGGSASRRAQKS